MISEDRKYNKTGQMEREMVQMAIWDYLKFNIPLEGIRVKYKFLE